MRFIPYLIFVGLWVVFIYSPVAHWVWGGDGLVNSVLLIMPGYSCAYYLRGVWSYIRIMIGVGKKQEKHTPHNLLITLIGGILVWLGWYGF